MRPLIGRKKETERFLKLARSPHSDFIAVYGRRRVGKTFLIRSVFKNKFTFQITGMANTTNKQQLINFHIALKDYDKNSDYPIPENWFFAFQYLMKLLKRSRLKKKIIFIDELPWFDIRKSDFMRSLEYFWNSWASKRDDILLIVCGSATSWMINKLINSKGGLHNRVTGKFRIDPFTLGECMKFMNSQNSVLDKYQVIQLYMAIGGIPFYWEQVDSKLSAMQNINEICFSKNGILRTEFKNLFRSLFSNYEKHISVVNALAKKSKGLTRDEIVNKTDLTNAGSTTRLLEELEESGFIRRYTPFGKKKRNSLYQLVDFYSHFYHKFIKDTDPDDSNSWLTMIDSPKYRAWSGYAFEQVCMYHTEQIKYALGISGIQSSVSSWRSTTLENGVQVDLIIDRRDNIVNLCEVKFSINKFTIDKKYAQELRDKISAFRAETKTRKAISLTIITTFGLNINEYSTGIVNQEFDMDKLFISPLQL